jgi:hypothetical protein
VSKEGLDRREVQEKKMMNGSSTAAAPTSMLQIPVGFRFHPTDEELVGYYLHGKVASKKSELDIIRDLDLYKLEPWDLHGTQEWCNRIMINLMGFILCTADQYVVPFLV